MRTEKDTAIEQTQPAAPGQRGLLAGKVAVVTGASRGIGAATALAFAEADAQLVLAARDERALDGVAEQVSGAGGRALRVVTDVTSPTAVQHLIERTLAEYGHLDIAFNNAGEGHRPVPLAQLADEDFDRVLTVNARGVYLAMKHELAAMLANDPPHRGAIVNMSSTAGLRGVKGIAGYLAGKHAILGLTKGAALDYADAGIRVNAVAPGPIATARLAGFSDQTRAAIAARLPIGRLGRQQEVAAAVCWLCSEQASLITRATIPVDGGLLAGGA